MTAVLFLAALLSATSAPETGKAYERALERALERAQDRLESELRLLEDHSTWETAWEVRSQHYVVRTVHSYNLGRNIADGLETMLGHFQSVLDTRYVPPAPFQVFIFPTTGDYNAFGDPHGDHSSLYGSFYPGGTGQPVAAVYDPNWTRLQMYVTHSALHQFVEHAFGRAPDTWISEGLASYFALYWDLGYGPSELRNIVAKREFIPLTELTGQPIAQYRDRPHTRFMELGTLFLYLLHYRDDTRMARPGEEPREASFADYVRVALKGGDERRHPFYLELVRHVGEIQEDFVSFEFP